MAKAIAYGALVFFGVFAILALAESLVGMGSPAVVDISALASLVIAALVVKRRLDAPPKNEG